MSESSYTEAWLVGPQSTNFYTRTYVAEHPTAVLVFVHGSSEHVGRHTRIHTLYAQRGITVFTYDLRGYGRTASDKEHKSKDSTYGKTNWKMGLEDIEWAIKHAHAEYPGLPIFLMGFSMGGGVVLGFPTRETAPPDKSTVALLSGVIGFSPTIHVTHPPKFGKWIGNAVRMVAPYANYPAKNKVEYLSRNPETNAEYMKDTLNQGHGSLQALADMLDYGNLLLEKHYQFWPEDLPVLFVHGTEDQVTNHKSTEAFYNKLAVKDKKLVLFPGALHELHNEPDGVKEKFLEEIVGFIESHSKPQ